MPESPEDYIRPFDIFETDPVKVYYQHLPGGPFNRFTSFNHGEVHALVGSSWTKLCYWREICARQAAEAGIYWRGPFQLLDTLEYRIFNDGKWPYGLPPFAVTGQVRGYVLDTRQRPYHVTGPLLTIDPLRVLVNGRPTPIFKDTRAAYANAKTTRP